MALFQPPAAADAAAAQAAVTAELRRSTQALLDAIAPGDVAVWDRREALDVEWRRSKTAQ